MKEIAPPMRAVHGSHGVYDEIRQERVEELLGEDLSKVREQMAEDIIFFYERGYDVRPMLRRLIEGILQKKFECVSGVERAIDKARGAGFTWYEAWEEVSRSIIPVLDSMPFEEIEEISDHYRMLAKARRDEEQDHRSRKEND